jgi:hypothetical protein
MGGVELIERQSDHGDGAKGKPSLIAQPRVAPVANGSGVHPGQPGKGLLRKMSVRQCGANLARGFRPVGREQHGLSSHGESKQDAEADEGQCGDKIEKGACNVKHGLSLSG